MTVPGPSVQTPKEYKSISTSCEDLQKSKKRYIPKIRQVQTEYREMTIQTIHKPKKVLQTHVINVKAISNEIRHRLVVSETTAKHPNKSEAVETTSFVKAVKGQTPQWVKVSQNYFKNGTHLEFLEKNRRYNGCLHRPLHDEDIN